jgi:energy-coupling factor transporter ATP-binding protein EcfA2
MDIRKNASWIFSKIKNKFEYSNDSKKGDDRPFSLFVGVSKEKLASRPRMIANYNGRYLTFERQSRLGWINIVEDIRVNPVVEPNPHIIIVGMSGFGKSTLFKSMIIDIKNAKRGAIIFDAHNEHAAVVRSLGGNAYNAAFYGINIFDLNGLTVGDRISNLQNLFKEVYSLGHIQETKLGECLWYMYRKSGATSKYDTKLKSLPTVSDLLDEISVFIKNSGSTTESNTLQHLKGKVSLLNMVAFTRNFVDIESLKNGVNSFSLAELKNREAQIIYISELLKRLYSTMKERERERGADFYIMLDEAQFLINSSSSGGETISKLISEGRKYGFGVIIATHMASVLDKRMVTNAATFITFYAREPSEVNYVSNVLAGGDAQRAHFIKQRLMTLKRNTAIMMSDFVKNPVVVNTPRFEDIGVDDPLDENDLKDKILLFCRRPVLYGDVKYDSRIINSLLEAKELDTYKTNFQDKEETWLMKHNNACSIEHEVWVRKIRDYVSSLGHKVFIFNAPNGPDVITYVEGSKFAIEYETGKKDMYSTKLMIRSRKAKFIRTIVIVNDDFYEYYRKNLEDDVVSVIMRSEIEKIGDLLAAPKVSA